MKILTGFKLEKTTTNYTFDMKLNNGEKYFMAVKSVNGGWTLQYRAK